MQRTERDRASDLALATANARRALLHLTVGIDALCLGATQFRHPGQHDRDHPGVGGSAGTTPPACGVRAHDTPAVVRGLQTELRMVDFVGIRVMTEVPEGVVDVMYRPIRFREPAHPEGVPHRAGDCFVVNQLDTIAFENPAYFAAGRGAARLP